MGNDPQFDFGCFFDVDTAGYDPLADFDEGEDDESGGQQGPHAEAQASLRYAQHDEGHPAAQRIDDLLESLPGRRRVLLGLLGFLDVPRRSDAVQEKVDELQAFDKSVYTGFDYSQLLEDAGAIRKVEEDGSDFDEAAEQAPDIVEVDGVRFYKPTDGKQVYWLITDEGTARLESEDPYGNLAALLEENPQWKPIYRRVLELCSVDGGRKTPELDAAVNGDPLVQNPRRLCSFFVKGLEDCGALVWEGSWKATNMGRRGLEELLGDVADASSGSEVLETTANGGKAGE